MVGDRTHGGTEASQAAFQPASVQACGSCASLNSGPWVGRILLPPRALHHRLATAKACPADGSFVKSNDRVGWCPQRCQFSRSIPFQELGRKGCRLERGYRQLRVKMWNGLAEPVLKWLQLAILAPSSRPRSVLLVPTGGPCSAGGGKARGHGWGSVHRMLHSVSMALVADNLSKRPLLHARPSPQPRLATDRVCTLYVGLGWQPGRQAFGWRAPARNTFTAFKHGCLNNMSEALSCSQCPCRRASGSLVGPSSGRWWGGDGFLAACGFCARTSAGEDAPLGEGGVGASAPGTEATWGAMNTSRLARRSLSITRLAAGESTSKSRFNAGLVGVAWVLSSVLIIARDADACWATAAPDIVFSVNRAFALARLACSNNLLSEFGTLFVLENLVLLLPRVEHPVLVTTKGTTELKFSVVAELCLFSTILSFSQRSV